MLAGPVVETQSPAANTLQQRQTSNLALQSDNLALPDGEVTLSDLDLGYLADTSLQLGTQLETRIRVLDAAGTVLVDSAEPQVTPGLDLTGDPLVTQALQGAYASETTQEGRTSVMAVAMPAMVDGELAAVVYLTQPLRDVDAVLGDLRGRWAWSTAIALLLSGIVGLVLARAITRPLRRLTTAANAVAQGRFDEQVPVSSQDELGRLSRTFNDMVSRLRSARQTQTTFVANVSHELRTPLTAIKGMVETLRDGAVDDVSVRDRFLATVETETDRLIRLVNDLLVLTRADAEALNLNREPLDVAELARVTMTQLSTQATGKGISLQARCKTGDAPGLGRPRPRRPGAGQPAGQRDQVLARARSRYRVGGAGPIDRRRAGAGHRPGHRHPRRGSATHRTALLPRGQGPRAPARPRSSQRQRAGALHRHGPRRGARRAASRSRAWRAPAQRSRSTCRRSRTPPRQPKAGGTALDQQLRISSQSPVSNH